jgi:hypothetical protein
VRGLQRCTDRAPDWAFDKRGSFRAPSWALSVELDQTSASVHVPVPGSVTQGRSSRRFFTRCRPLCRTWSELGWGFDSPVQRQSIGGG